MEQRGIVPLRTHGPGEYVIFARQVREMAEKLWPVRVLCCSQCQRLAIYDATPDARTSNTGTASQ